MDITFEHQSNERETRQKYRKEIIRLHPLSFSEYLPVSGMNEFQAWEEYLVCGGMPEAVLIKDKAERKEYLSGLFDTLYFKDIVERNKLRDEYLLGFLVDILMSGVGSLTNVNRIAETLKSVQKIQPDPHTLASYLSYLIQAYLFNKAERYDVKGRKYLSYPSKYYAEDIGLRNARLNYRQSERTI